MATYLQDAATLFDRRGKVIERCNKTYRVAAHERLQTDSLLFGAELSFAVTGEWLH